MKSLLSYMLLSVLVVSFYGCSNSDDFGNEADQQYNFSVQAIKESGDVQTRALFLGGNNSNRFYSLWDSGDKANVYKEGTFVGNLTPAHVGETTTELVGILSGSYAVNDMLDVYVPSATMDFTGQKGTVGDLSSKHSFMMKTAKVISVSGTDVTTEKLEFVSRQCYVHFQFTDADGVRLHVEQLIISAASGKLVLTKTKEGDTTYGDLEINLDKENGEYPSDVYVALHNDSGAKDVYNFTVKADGYTYYSTESAAKINANLQDGHSYNANKQLTLQSAASRITTTSSVNDFGAGNGASGEAGSVNF